ncbi:MAG: Loki-CTERM sorting domain-containing protein [Promethearchaeota archaeon]
MIKIRTHKSIIISIFLGILILAIINGNNFRYGLLTSESIHNNDEINLKSAGFWNLTGNPILIDDTDPSKNWSYTASNYDWCSGSGTWTNPYVIENVTINGQNVGSCIEIRNSNAYFVVNNCTLYSSGTTNYGIYLNYTNNGKIINNNCSVYYFGMFLDRSNNITVLGNDISNNQYGIAVSFSNNTIISENSVNNNLIADIAFQWSRNATLTKNILTSEGKELNFGGVFLSYSSSQEELASYTIDTTNLINGKPIYYYTNENRLQPNDFLNAGQIILVNCNDSLISNVNITDVYQGITIMYGNNNTITNSSLDNAYHGILVINISFNNVISGNIMKNCYYGITLYYDNNTLISRNVIEKSYYGIYLSSMYNNTVSGNIVSNCDVGIAMSNGNNTKILKNSLENNEKGIYLSSSSGNIVSRNIIRNNKEYGVYISENIDPSPSTQNLFFQNSFLNNSVHAYDGGIDNYWNNSIIGNYWDNYTGIDSNDDGIGDTPHTFQNGTDYLPIVDTTAPIIIINLPISLEAFEESAPDFNVEITDVLLDTMWYTLDNGVTNTTFTSNDTINQGLWDALPEGNVIIRFYANDSAGNIGFAEITIRKDVTVPIITINNPQDSDVIGATAPNFDMAIDEPNLDKTWYSLNEGNNITFTGLTGTINQALWSALPDGNVVIRFYANDSAGNIGFAEVTIKKDVNAPIITITNPQDSDVIGATAPNFDISIEELNLDKTWYSLNGGNNMTFTGLVGTINQAIWDAMPEGNVIIRFYANDTLGSVGFQEVTVVKTISQPPPPGIPGYNILLLLGIISTIAVIIIKKRLNHLN